MICDIEDKQLIQTTYIENHHEHEHDHSKGDHGNSHADMVNQLKAYQLMITKKVGPHFGKELQEANIPVEITDLNTIEEVLDTLLNQ
jgi:predicted Fe-Mo cluster-binding NifX family protein